MKQEEIGEEANRINQYAAETDRNYKQTMANITKQYNEARIELETAQGQRKLDLQAEMNGLEAYKAQVDAMYKSEMSAYTGMRVEVESKAQQADEYYKKKMVDLGYDKNDIDRYLANVQNKRAEYQNYYNLETLDLQSQSLAFQYAKLRQDWNINSLVAADRLTSIQIQQGTLDLAKEQFEFNKKIKPIEFGMQATNQVTNVVGGIFRGSGFKLFDLLGGSNNGPKSQFEALFK